jgi:Phage integrase, N-terminal SAM-like domain
VTQLRQKMLEELQRRNYSHRTAKTYIRIVRDFAEHFHQPPDKLGPEQIRQYQAHSHSRGFCKTAESARNFRCIILSARKGAPGPRKGIFPPPITK